MSLLDLQDLLSPISAPLDPLAFPQCIQHGCEVLAAEPISSDFLRP